MPVELLGRTILLTFLAVWGLVFQIILRDRQKRRDEIRHCSRATG